MSAVTISTLGCRVNLVVGGGHAAEALHAIRAAWAWSIVDSAGGEEATAGGPVVVLDDDEDVVEQSASRGALATTDLAELMHRLSQEVTLSCIDAQAGRLLMLHAGAVADPDTRRTLAVVAPSGTGKTTFVRSIGRGRFYLSDETVGLADDMVVVPHPKPLSVTSQTNGGFKEQLDPESFGMHRPSGDCVLAGLWFLERTAEPVEPRLETLDVLEALTTVAPQMSYLSSTPRPLRRLAETFDAVGGLTKVTYHEAADLRPYVDDVIGGTS